MFDFKFDWCKEMECGIPIIDEQNKTLFRIGRDIEQLITSGCANVSTKQLLDIVCDLREYVAYHFYFQEEMMRNGNYKGYEEHKKKHDEFKRYILGIDNKELKNNPIKVLSDLKSYLQEWLFQHILSQDRAMYREVEHS